MPQIVLHDLKGHWRLPRPALQRMRCMGMSQIMRAGFLKLLCIDAPELDGGLRQECLDRLVQPRG